MADDSMAFIDRLKPQGGGDVLRSQVFSATWQRCRVHFMRNVLVCVPKLHQGLVSTPIRPVF